MRGVRGTGPDGEGGRGEGGDKCRLLYEATKHSDLPCFKCLRYGVSLRLSKSPQIYH